MTSKSVGNNSVMSTTGASVEPEIWTVRNIEWPLPAKIAGAIYLKLWQSTVQLQQQQQYAQGQGGLFAKVAAATSARPNTAETAVPTGAPGITVDSVSGGSNVTTTANSPNASAGPVDSNATFLTGFMSRVLGPAANAPGVGNIDSLPPSPDVQYYVRPPRPGCVASSNGWIVAAVECTSELSSLSNDGKVNTSTNNVSNNPYVLRLISRWNVRRANFSDQWIPLPPPTTIKQQHTDCSIRHVFVDPTASHTLISAANGELYYLHSAAGSSSVLQSSTQHQQSHAVSPSHGQVVKLAGFGMMSSKPEWLTGVPATSVSSSTPTAASAAPSSLQSNPTQQGLTGSQKPIQVGLSLYTFVTAVAWDRERGTEGSTKKILLGTSAGEIYEYSLSSANASGVATSESKINDSYISAHQPVLLHKLYHSTGSNLQVLQKPSSSRSSDMSSSSDSSEVGAAVTGLYFERLRTGLLVIAATSGKNKRTRFYTFYSPHSSSFRMVLSSADNNNNKTTLQELPGSIDSADLRLCNDYFALRTATGIFYGTIDRSLSGPAGLSGGGSVVIDSGMISYDILTQQQRSSKAYFQTSIPVSLALTPHHIVTLSDTNEVCFINRVVQKVVQREHIDCFNNSANSSMATEFLDTAAFSSVGELIMDIRRPDQVWLRKCRSLVHISPNQEDRDVWKFTLFKCLEPSVQYVVVGQPGAGQGRSSVSKFGNYSMSEEEKTKESLFEQAKSLCTSSSQKSVVTAVRAEYCLFQGHGDLAAKYLAQCPVSLKPFADTAIRLALPKLEIDDPQGYGTQKAWSCLAGSNLPLITYLNEKLRICGMNNDRMACTMLGAWLTQLIFHERSGQIVDNNKHFVAENQNAFLTQFLSSNVASMDSKVIIKILTSHDVMAPDCAAYASRSGDVATAINAALSVDAKDARTGALDALLVLKNAPFEVAEPLYYKYATALLSLEPKKTFESFLSKYAHGLSPVRLLPCIIHYEKIREIRRTEIPATVDLSHRQQAGSGGGVEESKICQDFTQIFSSDAQKEALFIDDEDVSIRYLASVVEQGCSCSAVWNYLVSLYIKLENEDPLHDFLASHVPESTILSEKSTEAHLAQRDYSSSTPLDLSFAMRAVLGSGRHFRSAIKLYMGLGMRQQAVELALSVDPTLAREIAQDSVDLEERKRLWLMIAKTAAGGGDGDGKDVVSRVVSVLRDCGHVLSIEDVLPFLPDFAQIDQIKDEICEALTSYSSKIEELMREMKDCDSACESLRVDIRQLRNYHMRINANARCAFTNQEVLRAGEPFYVFPSGYVILSSALKTEVLPYLSDRQRERVKEIEHLLLTNRGHMPKQTLELELDGIIASECPLTGSIMVESVDREFDDCDEICNEFDSSSQRLNVERNE